ncbi:hypothetical protein ANCCAN_24990 [Ancylostoma caninum]|uniref:Endonuclease/exonuclease/phosphatase domain-containing protein n=1 Tax=Ancylostoma caninum TaxID=29170 RepID=A0A368FGF0_ANCCA|nr:hypothetical protein ANCCAN_24990 [Ancylostoma caninum]
MQVLPPFQRIIELLIKLNKEESIRIIQVHAPHSSYEDQECVNFLDSLAHTIDERKSTHLVILGDFNATPGLREYQERYTGINAAEPRNHRERMLTEFWEERHLFIANSFFKKKSHRRWA